MEPENEKNQTENRKYIIQVTNKKQKKMEKVKQQAETENRKK